MSTTSKLLPRPTNRTAEGPRFRGDANQTVVEYDYQRDDGARDWITVVFDDVLQFDFRPVPCCRAEDVVAATHVRVLAESERLSTTLNRWQESVGWQEWQQQQGGAARFRHFTMFFDDAGCIDVVAAACRLPASSEG
jgi:hypothetical protein